MLPFQLNARASNVLGLVLTAPVVLQCLSHQFGIVVPFVDQAAQAAIAIAGALGLPILACSPSVVKKKD